MNTNRVIQLLKQIARMDSQMRELSQIKVIYCEGDFMNAITQAAMNQLQDEIHAKRDELTSEVNYNYLRGHMEMFEG